MEIEGSRQRNYSLTAASSRSCPGSLGRSVEDRARSRLSAPLLRSLSVAISSLSGDAWACLRSVRGLSERRPRRRQRWWSSLAVTGHPACLRSPPWGSIHHHLCVLVPVARVAFGHHGGHGQVRQHIVRHEIRPLLSFFLSFRLWREG